MSKKEKRLSPKGKEVLEDIRQNLPPDIRDALKYLKSINSKELTMYDRQKIGREARRKMQFPHPSLRFKDASVYEKFDQFKKTYNLKEIDDNPDGTPGVISFGRRRLNAIRSGDRFLSWARDKRDDYSSVLEKTRNYYIAGRTYTEAGALDKAERTYIKGIEYMDNDLSNNSYKKSIRKEFVKGLKEIEHLRDERKKKHTSSIDDKLPLPAIITTTIGILGGLFLMSPNITGNAIADINTSNSNIIGAILFIIGLIGGFFWIKSSKNN
ncbi:MAG: hypothetical protein AABX94_02085 [Nanoarchaeota archaeon]